MDQKDLYKVSSYDFQSHLFYFELPIENNTKGSLKQVIDRFLFIKLNRLFTYEMTKYSQVLNKMLSSSKDLYLFRVFQGGIFGILSMLHQMVTILLGAYLINKGMITIGLLLSFINISQKVANPVEYFSTLLFSIKDLQTSYQRITPLINNQYTNENQLLCDSNTESHLICRNISLSLENKLIIKDLNLQINRGEKVALMGQSGVGKSSLCRLIAGIYEYDGEVIINYFNSNDKSHLNVGFILDESSVFNGTIRENLIYGWEGEPFSDLELDNALREACLEYYLRSQSQGFESVIHAEKMSHGEKQRLELARMFLIKPRLLILDEATSGLDADTELTIWKKILGKF